MALEAGSVHIKINAPTDPLERARQLIAELREVADQLEALYGPLWHERAALRRDVLSRRPPTTHRVGY